MRGAAAAGASAAGVSVTAGSPAAACNKAMKIDDSIPALLTDYGGNP
jgi:hypothetical protein